MEKDNTILNLLKTLRSHVDFTSIKQIDYWESDLFAIGLRKEHKQIYISTFNFANTHGLKYDYDLERISPTDETNFIVIKEGRDVTLHELIDALKLFFEL